MSEVKFRPLRADEVDVRIGTAKEGKGVSLLLYKDARCDMNVLDETVGPTCWQKHYSRDNANCTVSIWDDAKNQWISKEDTGTESNTEAEKGLASDSFKRACVNWGIGRELYTAPFIWINGATKYDKFWVSEMKVEKGKITSLVICRCNQYGDQTDEEAFRFPKFAAKKTATRKAAGQPAAAQPEPEVRPQPVAAPVPLPPSPDPLPPTLTEKEVITLEQLATQKNVTIEQICQRFRIRELKEMNSQQYTMCLSLLHRSSGRAAS